MGRAVNQIGLNGDENDGGGLLNLGRNASNDPIFFGFPCPGNLAGPEKMSQQEFANLARARGQVSKVSRFVRKHSSPAGGLKRFFSS